MTTLNLIEYAWNGTFYVSGATLSLDPYPSSMEKHVRVEWRTRHTGLYSLEERAKMRYRRTNEYTLKGGCLPEKRREIEFYTMRASKFKIVNTTFQGMLTPLYYSDRNTPPYQNPWQGASHPNQTVYVIFDDATFTLEEGKNWVTYSLKIKIVNTEGVQNP